MELTWLTKLLLWLLNKRPDICNIDVHETVFPILPLDQTGLDVDEYLNLPFTPELHALHADYLNELFDASSDSEKD